MPLTMRRGKPNRKANIWTARCIPLLLVGIIAYSSFVLTKLVCVEYLINPRPSLELPPRPGSAAAILTTYYLLLIVLLICYGRLVHTIIFNPGLIARGPQWYVERQRKKKGHPGYGVEKEANLDTDSAVRYTTKGMMADEASMKVSDFWMKDMFVCQYDGRPPFCSSCFNWKVDRAHHCSELGRCVYKMDHFCPWVGGIVSETSFKYFIQFTFWTALFCLEALVVMTYYFAERRRRGYSISVHWILVIAFAALFLLFGVGMCGSSLQFAFENTTTIENLDRRSRVWYLAIHIPNHVLSKMQASPGQSQLRMITYPRPAEEQLQILQSHGADTTQSQTPLTQSRAPIEPPAATEQAHLSHTRGTITPNQAPSSPSIPAPRTFAILATKPGDNPFCISPFENFKEVMGYRPLDWFLPVKPSPCTNHDSPFGMYRMGSTVRRMKRDAGMLDEDEMTRSSRTGSGKGRSRGRRHKRRRRRRRSTTSGSANTSSRPRSGQGATT